MVRGKGLREHSIAVARVCENFARLSGNDVDRYYVAGLLHDADYEQHPVEHPKVIVEYLLEVDEAEIAYAISAHGSEFGNPPISLLDRTLFASDELTGFVVAVAKVRPNGLAGLTATSVLKRFKDKKFAAGVHRDEVAKAVQTLGVQLPDYITFIIGSLQPFSAEIGLPDVSSEYATRAILPTYEDAPFHPAVSTVASRPDLDEQQTVRYRKREDLIAQGYDPYPGELFQISAQAADVHAGRIVVGTSGVQLAGRIMAKRESGKTAFLDLQDSSGIIQLWVNEKVVNTEVGMPFEKLLKLLDRGDIIGVSGDVFITNMGTVSIKVIELNLLTKSLKPLPTVKAINQGNQAVRFDDVTDPEFAYRQRYADLIIHPEKRDIFVKRATIVDTLRACLNRTGALEVSTPILQPIHGGASARPFKTHHNALNTELYLRIANELYLKRLIVGGFDAVFEFSVDFRNEGMDRTHNPEFTQVEAYFAYKDYRWIMDWLEATVEEVVRQINNGNTEIVSGNGTVLDFKRPWKRMSMQEAILNASGIDILTHSEAELRNAINALQCGVNLEGIVGKGKVIDELFGALVEPSLQQPTFITGYPVELSPLAKKSVDNPEITDRFEAFAAGKEFCNAFSEINDPVDQRSRFEDQLALNKRGDQDSISVMDEDFLRALEYGMPPTAGIGIGIERLTMMLTGQRSIQDVMLFPQMRPEK